MTKSTYPLTPLSQEEAVDQIADLVERLTQLQHSAAKGLEEIIELRQKLAETRADNARTFQANWGMAKKLAEAQAALLQVINGALSVADAEKQDYSALRAFVLGLLPPNKVLGQMVGWPAEGWNAVLDEIRANLEKALEKNP